MRLSDKSEYIQKCKGLQRKQELLAEYVKKYSGQQIYELLVELQSEALGLGNALEEKGQTALVTKLEIYCEQIYECSLVVEDAEEILNRYQKLQKLSANIEADIEAIQVKVKIAFFPYKISMWDSLESIWEAAERDENCVCQVVPIPYYTKDDAGKIQNEYYEGEKFALSAPVTDYRTYFIEKEKPDIMYIHNPYDQYNKVTMVEPRFFSTELKKGGGILVYVPYYISGYCSKYEYMLNACGNIGAVHSDFIIMQCENLKEAYAYCGFPEKRLLVLGSPKIDAIHKIKYKEYGTVDKWKSAIENRKVILLNTSISTCLQNHEWLDNIREFVEPVLQDDRLALIWRPHPLLLDAIQTLVKEEKQYGTLLDRITNASNAIIDDSETAEAAIQVSDAMISDYSSLVMQYSFTGKPTYLLTGKSTDRKYHVFCDYFSNYFRQDGVLLEDFLDMVIQGTDAEKEERLQYTANSMANTDGTCGEKIHQEIYRKVMESIK